MVSKAGHRLYRLIAIVFMCMFHSSFGGGKIDSREGRVVIDFAMFGFSLLPPQLIFNLECCSTYVYECINQYMYHLHSTQFYKINKVNQIFSL
jgi:hypothetical protein